MPATRRSSRATKRKFDVLRFDHADNEEDDDYVEDVVCQEGVDHVQNVENVETVADTVDSSQAGDESADAEEDEDDDSSDTRSVVEASHVEIGENTVDSSQAADEPADAEEVNDEARSDSDRVVDARNVKGTDKQKPSTARRVTKALDRFIESLDRKVAKGAGMRKRLSQKPLDAHGTHPNAPRPVFDRHWSEQDEEQLCRDLEQERES
ncbi:hypothetical protein QQX98_011523 [Neonectria punicea]|uniref:Uncharacterized protein n=1 Tax=Neonectria punicea TaxID=979145 RepID=A0ABR1GLM3_9HYPO